MDTHPSPSPYLRSQNHPHPPPYPFIPIDPHRQRHDDHPLHDVLLLRRRPRTPRRGRRLGRLPRRRHLRFQSRLLLQSRDGGESLGASHSDLSPDRFGTEAATTAATATTAKITRNGRPSSASGPSTARRTKREGRFRSTTIAICLVVRFFQKGTNALRCSQHPSDRLSCPNQTIVRPSGEEIPSRQCGQTRGWKRQRDAAGVQRDWKGVHDFIE
mmetsp:Transcript_21199/g.44503  ORF Transcript_21199/g.44503 Transcript_21199/m.44503 type:complete len:215 (+) Transcript_21199:452-1096(+)